MQARAPHAHDLNPTPTRTGFLSWALLIAEFARARLVSAVTLSAATGYFMFSERVEAAVLLPVIGVFFLGCGCSAVNQIQEARTDGRMDRTKNRPIPTGKLDLPTGWFIAILMLLAGFCFLASIEHHTYLILGLGLFTLIWYHGVYTYLKIVTPFAVIPGALLGVIPPLIGWCAAGGVWNDPLILLVAFYFFVWQVPHFWLLMLLRGKEYESAGLRSMTDIFDQRQFYRITFIWLVAAAVTGYFIALFAMLAPWWSLAILISSIWLVTKSLYFLRPHPQSTKLRPAFLRSIVYTVLLMLFLSLDALTQPGID